MWPRMAKNIYRSSGSRSVQTTISTAESTVVVSFWLTYRFTARMVDAGKRGFSRMTPVVSVHRVLATPCGFDSFTDHHVLISLFDLLAIVSDFPSPQFEKLYGGPCDWVLITIREDILNALNTYGLIFWDVGFLTGAIRRLLRVPLSDSLFSVWICWPHCTQDYEGARIARKWITSILRDTGRTMEQFFAGIWIPDSDDKLQLRLCIVAHNDPGNRRGAKRTE